MHSLLNLAYLDAGTGSLIIQAVIGAAAGVALFGRQAIVRVKHNASKLKSKLTGNSTEDAKSAEKKDTSK